MSTASSTLSELADRFHAAIAGHDVDALRPLFHPDAAFFVNGRSSAPSVDAFLALIARQGEGVADMRFEDDRVHIFDGGWVHVLTVRGARKDGVAFEIPSCAVVLAEDGRVRQVEEFLNVADLAPLIEVYRES